MRGNPVIKGTRITVSSIVKRLSEGATLQQVLAAYPGFSATSVNAALAYTSDFIANETTIPNH